MVAPCVRDSRSHECTELLQQALGINGTVDDHFLSSQPAGLQHTGHFGAWTIAKDHPEYIVRCETEEDVIAAVRFAHEHRLRLVVKNTGHGTVLTRNVHSIKSFILSALILSGRRGLQLACCSRIRVH
jgi:hypothetical protein